MIKKVISSTFDDAAFAFAPLTQSSFFVEGTVSELLALFIRDIEARIPESYLAQIPVEYKSEARKEAERLRKLVRSFLNGGCEASQLASSHSAQESSMTKLLQYAVANWQVVN